MNVISVRKCMTDTDVVTDDTRSRAVRNAVGSASVAGDRLPERGNKRRKRTEKSKSVRTTPTRTYCKCNKPLPYYHPKYRTPWHGKFTQDHRTTRPPHYWFSWIVSHCIYYYYYFCCCCCFVKFCISGTDITCIWTLLFACNMV